MNEQQFLQLRRGVEAQLRWALRHNGDEELLDILCSESQRLSEIIRHCRPSAKSGSFPSCDSSYAKAASPSLDAHLSDDLLVLKS
jgi:hypothetical protein